MDMWITSVDNLCVSSEYLVEKNNFDNLINKHRFIFEKKHFLRKYRSKKKNVDRKPFIHIFTFYKLDM
ncbi:hypothetical protein AFR80_13365 [Listeria monocytogenes]|nr:hypothetical protein [Listeria monocytogenes]